MLANKGEGSERRPDFTRDEYRTLIRKLPHWIKQGKAGKPTDMRYLLRDYVLILANTGIRHGTEALNIRPPSPVLLRFSGLGHCHQETDTRIFSIVASVFSKRLLSSGLFWLENHATDNFLTGSTNKNCPWIPIP